MITGCSAQRESAVLQHDKQESAVRETRKRWVECGGVVGCGGEWSVEVSGVWRWVECGGEWNVEVWWDVTRTVFEMVLSKWWVQSLILWHVETCSCSTAAGEAVWSYSNSEIERVFTICIWHQRYHIWMSEPLCLRSCTSDITVLMITIGQSSDNFRVKP